ncbi:TIGR02117 family protein [Rhizobium sp. 0TCS1.26]|uniref:TIGR02117 family protein n=1 Tax=Rhizobium sp. 0TCS1.26 TaxID=3142623 RepID=UPI003D27A904
MTKIFCRLLVLVAIPLLAAILGTLVPRPLFSTSANEGPATREVLVLSNPIHTDLALRLDDDLRRELADLGPLGFEIDHPGAAYLIIGWGGRAFYIETPTWGELKPVPLFKAMTIDSSVMHVDLAGEISPEDPTVRRLEVTEEGYRRLLAAIGNSFARKDGRLQRVADAAYGEYDAFFEANGGFNALLGCNTWTGAMLRTAGIRTGWWTPLPPLLAWSLDLHQ